MTRWLDKIKALKMGPWLLAVLCCALAALLMSVSPGQTTAMTEEESRISQTLSRIAGAGQTRVAVYYAQEAAAFGTGSGGKTPVGAVIVAQGAGDIAVRLQLQRAAQTLLGLSAQQVEVFPMEESP
ncbi:MAG: hypothetical protein IJ189_06690 [Clostridia bacterium]|nr:hypothetical protein [Clostridia bacterium]